MMMSVFPAVKKKYLRGFKVGLFFSQKAFHINLFFTRDDLEAFSQYYKFYKAY